jgi:hypothetical protein
MSGNDFGDSGGLRLRSSSMVVDCSLPLRPPILILRDSTSTARHVTKNPVLANFTNFWPSLSSRRQTSPLSVQTIALWLDIGAIAVKVASTRGPSNTFRPARVFRIGWMTAGCGVPSSAKRLLDGDTLRFSSTLHILICLVPILKSTG